MWNYIIDGLLILIIIIFTIIGIAKGLFESILGLVSTSVAIAVSMFTAKYVANFINKLFNFEELIYNKIHATDPSTEVFTILGTELKKSDVAKFVVWVISLIIVYLVVKLAIFILSKIFESITKSSPTISGLNRVFGMIFGLVKGGVIVIALLAVCSLISTIPGIGAPIYDKIADTKITSEIYKYVDDFVEKNVTEENIKDIVNRVVGESKPDKGGESGSTATA